MLVQTLILNTVCSKSFLPINWLYHKCKWFTTIINLNPKWPIGSLQRVQHNLNHVSCFWNHLNISILRDFQLQVKIRQDGLYRLIPRDAKLKAQCIPSTAISGQTQIPHQPAALEQTWSISLI